MSSLNASVPASPPRDPRRLTAYLIPYPQPVSDSSSSSTTYPSRFLLYTPPAAPLRKPEVDGQKEAKLTKVQRKWQEEVRAAKTSQAPTKSWKGVRAGATKGISNLMGKTNSSSIDFLGRVNDEASPKNKSDCSEESTTQKKGNVLQEIVLLYPPSLAATTSPEALRAEFINSMLRTKDKAKRDAIIATGLLPVAEAVDIAAMFVGWPFGGLMEIDAVWAYGNIRGAKTAKSVTNRLNGEASYESKWDREEQLKLTFVMDPSVEVLQKYLVAKCHKRDPHRFREGAIAPGETEVLEAIGWKPTLAEGGTKSWEDEQWERSEAKEDLKRVMEKGAKEWEGWCKAFEKDPEKALKR